MRVLISGVGIAGTTLAYWLIRRGMMSTLVERAPSLRAGGYIIDFGLTGYDIADRMGLIPELQRIGYHVQRMVIVNGEGHRIAGCPVSAFDKVTRGRFVSLGRGDLASALFRTIEGSAELRFGDHITRIDQSTDGARVTFASGMTREFDAVIGADGLHSGVRGLVFGPDSRYEKYLGIKFVAFALDGYSHRDELTYVLYTQLGQQVARFSMRDGRTMFLFTFADPDPRIDHANGAQAAKAVLRRRFADSGWECPQILDAMDNVDAVYFDRASQIRMDADGWSKQRVALVGDAAFCPSLLAGQGSSMAMTAAYVLAGEMHRAAGDFGLAFSRYAELLMPFMLAKQNAALSMVNVFAPRSRIGLFLRNRVISLASLPAVASLAIGSFVRDRIELPEYDSF